MLSTVTVYRSYQHLVCCYIVMSKVIKCQMSWNVKYHEMSNVMKCQKSWNGKCKEMSDVNKYHEMSNDMKFCQILVKMEERWEVIIPLYIGLLCPFQHFGEYMSVESVCWYWIYHANTWGMNVSTFSEIYICIGYMMPTIWGMYVTWRYMLILDILCQHLGD